MVIDVVIAYRRVIASRRERVRVRSFVPTQRNRHAWRWRPLLKRQRASRSLRQMAAIVEVPFRGRQFQRSRESSGCRVRARPSGRGFECSDLEKPQQGSDLCSHELREGEQEAHSTPAKQRIRFRRKIQKWEGLVASDVQQADRHRPVAEWAHQRLKLIVEFLFRRRQLPCEVKLFDPEKAIPSAPLSITSSISSCAARFASTEIVCPSRVVAGLRHSP